MSHHKRRRPKKRRAGCLLCKPHKGNGNGRRAREHAETRRAAIDGEEDYADEYAEGVAYAPCDDWPECEVCHLGQ